MATKFSPCKGSYVLNQFPSNVMFGMNGFHVSISQWSDTGPSWPSCLLTYEGLAVALSDLTESSLTNNASSACSSEATLILQFDIVKIKTSLVRQDFRRQKG